MKYFEEISGIKSNLPQKSDKYGVKCIGRYHKKNHLPSLKNQKQKNTLSVQQSVTKIMKKRQRKKLWSEYCS